MAKIIKDSIAGGPAIAVEADGDVLVWHNGQLLSENSDLKKRATLASVMQYPYSIVPGAPSIKASLESDIQGEYDYLRVTSALLQSSPGRAILVEYPQSVQDYLDSLLPAGAEDGNEYVF